MAQLRLCPTHLVTTLDTQLILSFEFLHRIEPDNVILADKGFCGIRAPVEGQQGIVVQQQGAAP